MAKVSGYFSTTAHSGQLDANKLQYNLFMVNKSPQRTAQAVQATCHNRAACDVCCDLRWSYPERNIAGSSPPYNLSELSTSTE